MSQPADPVADSLQTNINDDEGDMATIFISMSGEGRGHATRVRSLTEKLRDRHEVHLFAPGEAYAFLHKEYADCPGVRLVEIPGLKFHYVRGKIHLTKTIFAGLHFQQTELPRIVRQLREEIRTLQPAAMISDFEPALPRAALKEGRPFLSLTHQHFLLAYDMSWLPRSLRFFAWFIGLAVPLHYTRQKLTMISSFFTADFKPSWQNRKAISLGPMIRPEVRTAALKAGIPVDGPAPEQDFSDVTAANLSLSEQDSRAADSIKTPFLLSYLRKHTPERVVDELTLSPLPVRIYGLGERPARGPATFHAIDPQTFVDDLVACEAIVSAAGNQLLGECMYLGKPVLAIPETWHHEQLINAHFLRKMGCGEFVTLEAFQQQHLQEFLTRLNSYRTQIAATCLGVDGTARAVAAIEAEIELSQTPVAAAG